VLKIEVVAFRYCSRKVLIGKINTLIWFCCMKKSLMEDKRNEAQRPLTVRIPKGTSHW